MNKLFVWLGDSWTYGSEIDNPKKYRFTSLIDQNLGIRSINLAKPGISIDYLIFKLKQLEKIKRLYPQHEIIALFGLTAPYRLCIEDQNLSKLIISPNVYDTVAFKSWGKDIFSDQHIKTKNIINLTFLADQCRKKDIKFKFYNILCNFKDFEGSYFTSYLDESDWLVSSRWSVYGSLFDLTDFEFSKTSALEGTSFGKSRIKEYIYPCRAHPNILGHQKIADFLTNYIKDII